MECVKFKFWSYLDLITSEITAHALQIYSSVTKKIKLTNNFLKLTVW